MNKKGTIDRIEQTEEGPVAWGAFEDESTFDFPAEEYHKVGDECMFATDDDGYFNIIVISEHEELATIYYGEETEEGLELHGQEVLKKAPN